MGEHNGRQAESLIIVPGERMSRLEHAVMESLMRLTIRPPGVAMRSGYLGEIDMEGNEKRIQFVETSGPVRINVSELAKAIADNVALHTVMVVEPGKILGS
jgi:hypothetical protein